MIIHEYGDSAHPKVLLLHPMLTDAGCMRGVADSMKGDYCFIIPDFSAHGEDTGVYRSGKEEADELLTYLKKKGYTDIVLMMGASMGGVIGLYLLGDGSLNIKTAVFEGAAAYTGAWLLEKMMKFIFLKKHRKAVKMPLEAVEKTMAQQYGEAFAGAMARNFRRMDEESVKAVVHDCGNVYFPPLSPEQQRRMVWAVGDKDINYRKLNAVKKRYPHMNIIVQKGYGHCGYIAEHYQSYGRELTKLMGSSKEKEMHINLGDVEETALIPLSNRASETLRKKPRVRDETAVEIVRELGVDTKKYDKLITHESVIARTIMFDEALKKLIETYPNAVIANMGCGLDNRFERVDNGKIQWFDIDLPDSIEVRRKVYAETTRRKMIAGSVLETEWIAEIEKARGLSPVIAVAEGLFMYFSKKDTGKLLNSMTQGFEKGFLLVEMMNPSMMDEKKHETVKSTNARFGWGTKSGKEFEALAPEMKLVSEHSFAVQLRKSTAISKVIGLVSGKINNRLAVFKWQ